MCNGFVISMAYFCPRIINLYFMESTYLVSEVIFKVMSGSNSRSLRSDFGRLHRILLGSYFPDYSSAVKFVVYLLRFFSPDSKFSFKLESTNLDKVADIDNFYLLKFEVRVS